MCKSDLVSQYDSTVAQLKTLEGGGMAAHSKVLQAQARLESAKVELSARENRSDSMRIELVNFIQGVDTAVAPEPYVFPADNPGAASADTVTLNTGRPELTAMDMTISQLSTFNDILKGQKYPNLVIDFGYRYGKPGLSLTGTDFMAYGVASASSNLISSTAIRSLRNSTKIKPKSKSPKPKSSSSLIISAAALKPPNSNWLGQKSKKKRRLFP